MENSIAPPPKVKGVNRTTDTELTWMAREFPQLESWRGLALEWLKGETIGLTNKLTALSIFFDRYLVKQRITLEPARFLARDAIHPNFYITSCPKTVTGTQHNNNINAFLQFVLLHQFSFENDYGQFEVMSGFHNPVPRVSREGSPNYTESVRSPLPYGYIDELRQMIVAGPNFRDWQWIQNGLTENKDTVVRADWFDVTEEQIDKNDPDCVWRIRKMTKSDYRGGQVLEMWSPVRWVALLVKLILPLRTVQVRMLDSGEADTWRYESGEWSRNRSQLAQGNKRYPLQQGVFRRSRLPDGEFDSTVMYVNTNKTADTAKSGTNKGYLLPWTSGGQNHQDVYYWLEKLRNWQEKYNPISRRTSWSALDARHIDVKSKVQLASYPDACFLFRLRENAPHERNLPISDAVLTRNWFRLLEAFQQRLSNRGETHRNGAQILLLPPPEEQSGRTTLFPLHSLRVSLITALALEGKVPFAILQKLVGHSRLLMTLYYTKPGANHIRDVLINATEHLEAKKDLSIQNYLLNTEHDELLKTAICNDVTSISAAIPQHPSVRNMLGWMPMHHGLCLVGGSTSEMEGNGSVGGCYNGGAVLKKGTPFQNATHGPVPGGSRNCVRCRWFVTEPHYMPALVAHFNTLAYQFDEARNVCMARDNELQELKKQKADAEVAGKPFSHFHDFRKLERLWESAMKRFSDYAEDLVACWRLIEKCKARLDAAQGDKTQLIAAGTAADVNLVFEETESELLQLTGVCNSIELYPDLEPGKAVFRRSQLLDAVLYREGHAPLFMLLSEDEQLLAGNAFTRRLAAQINPENLELGEREVIRLIDAEERLSQHFDIDLTSLLPIATQRQVLMSRPGHSI